jgi:hypothetical protein
MVNETVRQAASCPSAPVEVCGFRGALGRERIRSVAGQYVKTAASTVVSISMMVASRTRCLALFAIFPTKEHGSNFQILSTFQTRSICIFRKNIGYCKPVCDGAMAIGSVVAFTSVLLNLTALPTSYAVLGGSISIVP